MRKRCIDCGTLRDVFGGTWCCAKCERKRILWGRLALGVASIGRALVDGDK